MYEALLWQLQERTDVCIILKDVLLQEYGLTIYISLYTARQLDLQLMYQANQK